LTASFAHIHIVGQLVFFLAPFSLPIVDGSVESLLGFGTRRLAIRKLGQHDLGFRFGFLVRRCVVRALVYPGDESILKQLVQCLVKVRLGSDLLVLWLG